MLHIALHFIVPAALAYWFFRSRWFTAWLWMMATMAVDLDHLLANPIYDPGRCSIGFHPLHEPYLFVLYLALCVFARTRLVGIGLLTHMALDSIDCHFTNGVWFVQMCPSLEAIKRRHQIHQWLNASKVSTHRNGRTQPTAQRNKMQHTKWGIIGPGKIAQSFSHALHTVEGAIAHSVLSRSHSRAQNFSKEFGFKNAHSSLDEFLRDPELEAVYIASPHSEHHYHSTQALRAGKAVLCEKSMTVNAQQAEALISIARESKQFFMEAVWTRCLPVYEHIRKWLDDGEIGQVRMIQASFGFNREYDPTSRLYDPKQGGGALLDVGIYPLTLCDIVMGEQATKVLALAQLAPNDVDQNITMLLHYENGALAHLGAGIGVQTEYGAWIYGDEGRIYIEPRFWSGQSAKVFANGASEPHIVCDTPHRTNGYEYEIEEVHRCLETGSIESSLVSHASSLRVMRLMDEIRRQVNVRYEAD